MAHQSELDTAFTNAQRDIHQLVERPDNATMLKLYAFYKQGHIGVNTLPSPSGFDFVGQAKHAAWLDLGLMTQEQAKQHYIQTVKALTT